MKCHYLMLLLTILIINIGCAKEEEYPGKIIRGSIVYAIKDKEGLAFLRLYNLETKMQIDIENFLNANYPKSNDGIIIMVSSNDGIYRIEEDNKVKLVNNNAKSYALCQDNLVYISFIDSQYRMVKTNLLTGETKEILTDSINSLSHLVSHNNILYYDTKNGEIYKMDLNNEVINKELILKGRYPEIRYDGTKIAYLTSKNYELVVYDTKTKKENQTGLKRVDQITWLGNTKYLGYLQWKTEFWVDYIELGVIDSETGKTWMIEKGTPASFGSGMTWISSSL